MTNRLEDTGERLIPEYIEDKDLMLRKLEDIHKDRYQWASQFVQGKCVLDIACGSGYGSQMLLDAGASKIIGVDIDPEIVQYAESKYQASNLTFFASDILSLEIDPVDIIVSFETIEHVPDLVAAYKKVKSLLKPGGLYIVSASTCPTAALYQYHVHDFDELSFKKSLLDARFEIVDEKKYLDYFSPRMTRTALNNHDKSSPSLMTMLSRPFYYAKIIIETLLTKGVDYQNQVYVCKVEK